jgi:hypothetical protein
MRPLENALRMALSRQRADGFDCSETLYRYASGDGTSSSDRDFRKHLESCAECRADLECFGRNTATQWPFKRPRTFVLPLWLRGFGLAAVCAGVIVLLKLHRTDVSDPGEGPGMLKAKGAATFHVNVIRQGQSLLWSALDHLLPGDELRFSYSAPTATYPVLVSADDSGTVMRLFPPASPVLVEPGEGTLGSAEIDTRPGCQWLVAAFASEGGQKADRLESLLKEAIARRPPRSCDLGPLQLEGSVVQVKSKSVLPP